MQDNDLPQIGTPMQTDETRVEVIQADRQIAGKLLASWDADTDMGSAIIAGNVDEHDFVQAFACHRAAFAAPPAMEREEGQPTLADIEHRSLRLQGESANAHGLTVGEPVSEWIAGRMKDAADRALAPSTPTLHPSDREAIAREVERARADERERCAALVDSHVPAPAGGPFSHTNSMRVVLIDAAKGIRARSAILALSGSLAPEGDTPSCASGHANYIGKCPYCHEELPGIPAQADKQGDA